MSITDEAIVVSSTTAHVNDPRFINNSEASRSGVSWGAILAGATAAAAMSLILLILGVGLGFSSVSPWAQEGVSATTFGVSSIVWITLMSLFASALGGYIAGRLRTKWTGIHNDEVFFRDTAHGLLAWAVATLFTAALLTSAVGAIISGGVKASTAAVGGIATAAGGAAALGSMAMGSGEAAGDEGNLGYFVDSLFRSNSSGAARTKPVSTTADASDQTEQSSIQGEQSSNQSADSAQQSSAPMQQVAAGTPPAKPSVASNMEVSRIFVNSIAQDKDLPREDIRYVAQRVAEQTDLTQAEAEKRVADTYASLRKRLDEMETAAKEAADKARKSSAYASLWFFISLLMGAFIASLSATFGGRQRDL